MKNKIIKIKIGVLIEKRNKLLLIKELNRKNGNYLWNIIKGTFEPKKDKNIFATAIRESKEETGVNVELKKIVNITHLRRNGRYIIQFNFLSKIKKGAPEIKEYKIQRAFKENISAIKYFTKKELIKMKQKEFLNKRAYLAIQDWFQNKKYPLKILKFLQ